MRWLAVLLAIACFTVGCTELEKGTAVTRSEPPQDVWQLVERAVSLVPLTVERMEALLGTSMTQSDQSPARWNGGPVQFSDALTVPSSTITIRDGAWTYAGFGTQSDQCITADMIKTHYPTVELTYGVTGHSIHESFGWTVSYDWGELGFGIRVKDDCLAGISLVPAVELKHQEEQRKQRP